MENNTYQTNPAPVAQLKTDRGLVKFILLSLVTLGIYSIVYYSCISSDINIIASRYDGKKTMHFCLMSFILTPITLGIYTLVWYHQLSNRISYRCRTEASWNRFRFRCKRFLALEYTWFLNFCRSVHLCT